MQRDGQAAGRLVTARDAESIRVVDIAFLPQEQGKDLGTACIRDLQAERRDDRIAAIGVLRGGKTRPVEPRLDHIVDGGSLGPRLSALTRRTFG